jgi:serine/threonine-protein kinase RsbW
MTIDTNESRFYLELPARVESVPRARHALIEFGARHGVDLRALGLAVTEAVTNVIRHAYADRTDGQIEIEAERDDGNLVVRVSDKGEGMRALVQSPTLRLGLTLIAAVANRTEITTGAGGVTVTMSFAAA